MTQDKFAAYRKAQAERGLVQVCVWVPKHMRRRLISYARRLKKEDGAHE